MIQYQKMGNEHVSQIAALEKSCFSDPWSEQSIASELDNAFAYWLVATENGEVVGYIGSQSVLDGADMMNLAVSDAYRRQGIGRNLVMALADHLRSNGICFLTLEVRVSNAKAIALYKSLEFQEVGRRPGYYRHPKEDALILRKVL